MADLREERCAALATPVTELMSAVLTAQGGSPDAFAEVIRAAEQVLAIAELGSSGIDHPEYASWAAASPTVLERIIEAAEKSDQKALWEAFSDPHSGLHRVAGACAGLPRW